MRCHAVHPLLVAFRDGELSPGESVRVTEHLDRCEACQDLDRELVLATPSPFLATPVLSADDEDRLSRALDHARVDPPAMHMPLFDFEPERLWVHLAWAATVALCLSWGWSNHTQAVALQAQLDAAPAQAETVLRDADFRAASWDPAEIEAEAAK